ncbi:UTP--glucose-1-phosphate uridylyltransferase [bacterium CG_4_10_14_0_2_um_filter_33_32]|nr:MAG: UTP--glucose-1-phosphate uridylyltransferase [bacterium CG2_30_33_46]PIU76855.1 MAG: UTP--glucose-1-phosphate uridylyltransferase [bacterium CG06_land_8_20_14_3_00_33_50]PIY85390.1 MAG: UTP--glucose-1-phosphate uridylyltransferase [bacterium CG_4_10_14_0_8_um_filter_33_57]PIZ86333.1 MAG: UTP--glucose-1-phosphate uridylyltransferase [bacterium CG_4_10_14_0_2_um_filter_33_32]PJA72179.1 MAG: UTP--glucose-1-phosphate uridylyltransferase [bacterium CG_4_9_14_3_um_filter_33_26]
MDKQKVTKAILPVAGLGTRFLPATIASPKEMLPLVDKPVIQYLVEEAVASGINELIMVTGRTKRTIEDHFDYSYDLEHALRSRGKLDLLKEIKTISNLANIVYVRQKEPLGDGHAILCAKQVINDEPFAVLFGDDLVDSKDPCLKQLMEVYEKYQDPVIAVAEVPESEVSRYGVIKAEHLENNIYQIFDMVEKPEKHKEPSNLAIVGKYIVTPDIFENIKKAKPGKDGEIRLIDGLKELMKKRPLYACKFDGTWYSTGHKLDFLKATVAYALKREDLKEFKDFLKKFLENN